MTDGLIYEAGWTLDDVQWAKFDPAKVNPALLAAVKAASLVEFNAPDYVNYLKRVYRDAPESTIRGIEHMDILETSAKVSDGAISEYQTHVRISFRLER